MTATKRCPRCRQVKPASQFYRRRGDQQLSSYCQPCARAADWPIGPGPAPATRSSSAASAGGGGVWMPARPWPG